MGRLSFAIALNLITDGFRKGANEVKGAFSSMQAKILTFSAGFDLIRSALAGFPLRCSILSETQTEPQQR